MELSFCSALQLLAFSVKILVKSFDSSGPEKRKWESKTRNSGLPRALPRHDSRKYHPLSNAVLCKYFLKRAGHCVSWTFWIAVEFCHNLSILIIFPPFSSLLLWWGFAFCLSITWQKNVSDPLFNQLLLWVLSPEELCATRNASVHLLPPSADPAGLPVTSTWCLGKVLLCNQVSRCSLAVPALPGLREQVGTCLCLSQQRNVEHLGTGSAENGSDLAVERCKRYCLHLMLFANGLWFPCLPT